MRELYKFESHNNIKNSKYYREILCQGASTFFLKFRGNKNSKYGAIVGYKQKIGRTGLLRLTKEQAVNWYTEKVAEAKSYDRAKLEKLIPDRNTLAWLYYIKNNIA